jgi:SSS family solute:Na+ symporter
MYFSQGKISLPEYFLARKQSAWWMAGFVAFVTNFSIPTFIDIGPWAYRDGLLAFNFELTGIVCCIIMSFFFSSIYARTNISTTSEYMELRYNHIIAKITAALLLLMNVLTRISVILISVSIMLRYFIPLDVYTTSLVLAIFCGVYSLIGGQKTNIRMGFFLGCLFLLGMSIFVFYLWKELSLQPTKPYPDNYFKLLGFKEGSNFAWYHIVLAMPIIGIWYHCVNQELVQMYMSTKSALEFQASALLHGYLKLLVFPFAILPGIWAYQLCQADNSEMLFPNLIQSYVPETALAFVLIGLLATSMVSLSASFNTCTTLFTFAFYKKKFPAANEFMLISIGKIALIVVVILSMVWVVLIQYFHELIFVFISSVFSYFTPPFAVIYLAGIFWKRANAKGAMVALVTGLLVGLAKFIITFLNAQQFFANESWWVSIARFNFFDFCILSFLFSGLLMLLVSLAYPAAGNQPSEDLLFSFPSFKNSGKQEKKYRVMLYGASALLFLIINFLYFKFH